MDKSSFNQVISAIENSDLDFVTKITALCKLEEMPIWCFNERFSCVADAFFWPGPDVQFWAYVQKNVFDCWWPSSYVPEEN